MPRPALVVPLVGALCFLACSTLAEVAGAPNRDAASIAFNNMKDSIHVGDTLGVFVQVNDASGRPALTDTVVVWESSNPAVVGLEADRPPTPTPHGFSWLVGRSSGQATVTAHTQKVSTSKLVTVVGPNDVAPNDARIAYALADQPSAAGPYSPDDMYQLNSSGRGITVTRDSTGWYLVHVLGLARQPGQRDNVQVTAYGSPAGTHCKLLSWRNDGSDLIVPVHCHRADGNATDSRFTILVSGARVYDLSSPFAFSERLPQTQNLALDTAQTSFNSVSGHINFGRAGVGVYNFVFAGLERPTTHLTLQATAIGQLAEHCRVQNYDLVIAVLQGGCNGADGVATDARLSVMWFTRGRAGHRYGFASTNNVGSVTPPVDTTFTLNSSGGAVTSRRLSAGQWTVTFAGLGRPTGSKETVIVSAFKDFDHTCTLVSWTSAGADLTVTLQCFNAAGTPFDGRFSVLVVE